MKKHPMLHHDHLKSQERQAADELAIGLLSKHLSITWPHLTAAVRKKGHPERLASAAARYALIKREEAG